MALGDVRSGVCLGFEVSLELRIAGQGVLSGAHAGSEGPELLRDAAM